MKNFRTISHHDAQDLIANDGAVVIDVRTPGEHDDLGHIPGSWLLPLDLVVSAPAVLPGDGRPVLVYCEHGVRSVAVGLGKFFDELYPERRGTTAKAVPIR